MSTYSTYFLYQAVDKLTPALKKMEAAQARLNKQMANSKAAADKACRSFKNVENASKKVSTSLTSVHKQLGRISRTAFDTGRQLSLYLTLPIAGIMGYAIKTASAATEIGTRFDVVFQGVIQKAKDASANIAREFRLAGMTSMEQMANVGDILTGLGFDRGFGLEVSEQVVSLAGDLASFYDVAEGMPGVVERLLSVMMGLPKAGYKVGIKIAKEQVTDIMKELGMSKVTGEAKRQIEMLIYLQLALRQSKNAIGDFERTWWSAANQMRTVKESVKQLADSFGQALLPVVGAVLIPVNATLRSMAEMSEGTKQVAIVIMTLVASIGPAILTFALLIKAVHVCQGAMLVLTKITYAQITAWSILMAKYILIAMAVGMIMKAFVALVKENKSLQKMLLRVGSVVKSITYILTATIGGVVKILYIMFYAIVKVVSSIITMLWEFFYWKEILDTIAIALKYVADGVEWLTDCFTWLGDVLEDNDTVTGKFISKLRVWDKNNKLVSRTLRILIGALTFYIATAIIANAVTGMFIKTLAFTKGVMKATSVSAAFLGSSFAFVGRSVVWLSGVLWSGLITVLAILLESVKAVTASLLFLGNGIAVVAGWVSAIGTAIGGAVTAIATALGLTVGVFIAIVAAIIAVVALVIIYWDEISEYFSNWGDDFVVLMKFTWDKVKEIWGKGVSWIAEKIEGLIEKIKKLKEWFSLLIKGGSDDMDININRQNRIISEQGKSTFDANINVTAKNATVDSAVSKRSGFGRVGFTTTGMFSPGMY